MHSRLSAEGRHNTQCTYKLCNPAMFAHAINTIIVDAFGKPVPINIWLRAWRCWSICLNYTTGCVVINNPGCIYPNVMFIHCLWISVMIPNRFLKYYVKMSMEAMWKIDEVNCLKSHNSFWYLHEKVKANMGECVYWHEST